ncbi:MAG: hypothetical protein HGB28_01030 [Oscillochloris sp.]|nr:hypothetical protein [Oscillochloris sp.]
MRVIRSLGVGWTMSAIGCLAWVIHTHCPMGGAAFGLGIGSIPLAEGLTIGVLWVLGLIGLWTLQQHAVRTISQREQLIVAQQTREHDLEVIFNSAPVIMIVVDAERRVRRANRVAIESAESPHKQMIGLRGGEVLRCLNASHDPRGCGFSPECANCQLRQVIAQTFHTRQSIYKRQAHMSLPSGMRDLLISTSLLTDLGEPLALVVIDDETERRRATAALQASNQQLGQALADLAETQQSLAHQERLAAVGQIAAGVAHDFNNIMTCIRGSAELIHADPQTPPTIRDDLEVIVRSSDRASSIVRQLLDFSRKSPRQLAVIDLSQLLRETKPLLASSIVHPVRLSWNITPGACLVRADPTQIQQVLINLALNARDAMPSGGDLAITLAERQMIEPVSGYMQSRLPEGSWICLSVSDTGLGIDPAILPQIFDPFFTTKGVGVGNGLGLSQVYGIVRQHAGHITVASRPDQGTRFAIYLPTAETKRRTDASAPLPVVLTPSAGRQVLLIAHDPDIQTEIGAMLAQLGYQALSVTTLPAALSCYAEHRGEVALVLAEAAMPELDTHLLLQTLRTQIPDIKVVLMGDEPPGPQDEPMSIYIGLDRIQKPVTLQRLSRVVK